MLSKHTILEQSTSYVNTMASALVERCRIILCLYNYNNNYTNISLCVNKNKQTVF